MMFLFQSNNITVRVGHLTHPPRRNQSQDGSMKTLFRIATKRYRPSQGRYYDFMLCIAEGVTAERAAKILVKGSVVSVAGPLQSYFTELKGAKGPKGESVEVERFYLHVSDFQAIGHYVQNDDAELHGGKMHPGRKADAVPYEDDDEHHD